MTIRGYAAHAQGAELTPLEWEPGDLGEDQVDIDVTHCGLCHSDTSMIRNEWGLSRYPLVPGHEVIGRVRRTGDSVSGLREGQVVGVGWQSDSCGTCTDCRRGDEAYCGVAKRDTIIHGRGGFADRVIVNARFAVPIPAGYDPFYAAPLMCGGITVFAPLYEYGLRPGMSVGIVGIGGLGHMAVQFARAMGCEVTAISTSPDKEVEARSFGAHHFLNSREEAVFQSAAGSFDVLLNTVSGDLSWAAFLSLLKARGTLIMVGVPDKPLKIPAFSLIAKGAKVQGSAIGSPGVIEEMFHYATLFDIQPAVERMALTDVNEAIVRLDANKARYRIVLENEATV